MPKSAKSSATNTSSKLSFEDALQKLESVVEDMESDELPLEKLLERFEQGTELASICQRKLTEAELKIKKLEKSSSGDFELKEFPLEESDA